MPIALWDPGTKLLPPRHCSKIPTPSTPSTPSTSLEPTLQYENCGERHWQDHLGRRQLKTISFQNWTQNEIEILNWNQLKPIASRHISTISKWHRHHRHLSEELGHAMQGPFSLCLVICEVHPPQVKNLTLVIFPWLIWHQEWPEESPGVTRSHQLRVSTHRTEISKWPSCFEHFEIRSSQAQSDVKWSKYI